MDILLIFFVIWAWAFLLSVFSGKNMAYCLPVTVMGQVTFLYIFGYAGILEYGVWAICILPLAGFVYVLAKKRQSLKPDTQLVINTILFGAVFVYFWRIQLGMLISQWDEFTHWGLIVKNMYALDNFGNTGLTTAAFLDYPPGQGLYRYMFMKICGVFAESRIFHAANIMAIVFAFPLIRKSRNIFTSATTIALFMLVLNIVSAETFHTIYIDLLLGIVWGHLLHICLAYERDVFFYLDFALTFVFLTLLKASGFGLALSVLIVMAVHSFAGVKNIKAAVTKFAPLAICSMTGIITKISWSAFLNYHNINPIFEFDSLTPTTFMQLVNGTAPRYRYQVLSAYKDALFNTAVFYIGDKGITAVAFTLATAIILIALNFMGKKDSGYIWAGAGIVMVTVIFVAGMLVSYLFSFSEYEAVNLASYDRYLRTIAMGAVVTAFAFICERLSDAKPLYTVAIMAVAIMMLNPMQLLHNITTRQQTVNDIYNGRYIYMQESRLIQRNTEGYTMMAYIAPGTNGYEFWQGKYECSPVMTWGDWSFSATEGGYFDGDIWTVTISPEDLWTNLTTTYNCVFIHSVNEKFNADYGTLFEGGSAVPGLYVPDETTGQFHLVEAMA
ncbi:MAG: hypothetical protein IKU54_03415 [Oscillospiraceae bacterium]|nr:hypothetical protein [Oscillospiraceae bacterium]